MILGKKLASKNALVLTSSKVGFSSSHKFESVYKPILHNFNAGPGTLPKEVMAKLQANLLDYKGLGISVIEMSHRQAEFAELA